MQYEYVLVCVSRLNLSYSLELMSEAKARTGRGDEINESNQSSQISLSCCTHCFDALAISPTKIHQYSRVVL